MAKYRIDGVPENCAGCLRCELACSDTYTKAFNPSAARIQVKMSGADCDIRFTEECIECGICVDHCLYGALSKTKKEED
jgi:NAD-dependent dihydropyrimidine dehydrogenase PreA subunit